MGDAEKQTCDDPAWQAVAQMLVARHAGEAFGLQRQSGCAFLSGDDLMAHGINERKPWERVKQ